MNDRIGKHVRITSGPPEFVGKTGRVSAKENMRPPMYRVVLDDPVEIPGVGRVRDDLWESRFLKTIRRR